MSVYNILFGMNASLVMVVSFVLGFKIEEKFPRFRDCFTKDKDCPIKDYDVLIYTKMGGGNRQCWEDNRNKNCKCPACTANALERKPFVVGRYDDRFDNCYSTFAIKFNKRQKALFNKFLSCKTKKEFLDLADPYIEKIYPNLYKKLKESKNAK